MLVPNNIILENTIDTSIGPIHIPQRPLIEILLIMIARLRWPFLESPGDFSRSESCFVFVVFGFNIKFWIILKIIQWNSPLTKQNWFPNCQFNEANNKCREHDARIKWLMSSQKSRKDEYINDDKIMFWTILGQWLGASDTSHVVSTGWHKNPWQT